jgi:fatty acid desaturase
MAQIAVLDPPSTYVRTTVDVPTLLVAVVVYAAFGLLTWYHRSIPWWLLLPLGGCTVCLHGSLQHEAVHGFPFRGRFLNSLLVFPSLWLWLPYLTYRESHLKHHRDERLTCPIDDPESNYLSPEQWAALNPFHKRLRVIMTTVAGRLLITPAYCVYRAVQQLSKAILTRDMPQLGQWAVHVPAVAIVLWWAMGVCDMSFWKYVICFAYPGLSLTLLRSFCEHRAAADVGHRTAVVEAGPLMSFLYLNNNLHFVHHNEPNSPWHSRPARYRQVRDQVIAANGGYRLAGYGEILRRWLLTPKEPVVHPQGRP